MAKKHFSMSAKQLCAVGDKACKAELKRRGRDSSGKKIGSRAMAKKPTPKKSAYKKEWYEGWPPLGQGGWLPPQVLILDELTWGGSVGVSYRNQDDASSTDIEIFPDGKSGKLRVKGEMSGGDTSGGHWREVDIDKRGLTKKQALAAVRKFFTVTTVRLFRVQVPPQGPLGGD